MISYLNVNLNGRELKIPVELTETQVKQLYNAAEHEGNESGWEEPVEGQVYFYEDALGRIQSIYADEKSKLQLELLYNSINCYSSETIANNIARGNMLIRTLRRFAEMNNGGPIDFYQNGGYTITYNYQDNCLECGMTGNWKALGDIVFATEEIAREAMNTYAEELVWYFTQMKERL